MSDRCTSQTVACRCELNRKHDGLHQNESTGIIGGESYMVSWDDESESSPSFLLSSPLNDPGDVADALVSWICGDGS